MEMHAVHVKQHMTLEQASKLADGVVVVAYIFEVNTPGPIVCEPNHIHLI